VATADAGVETPYLQLVMSELWRYERERGSTTLRTATLDELGGAEAIVQNHLDATVAALTPEDRDTCARMFQYLVTPSGTKIAYTSEDLAGLVERAADEIELVLAKLSGSSMRILSPVAPPTDRPGPVRYEIYHDSLAQAILDWRRRYVSDREKAELERQRQEQERELQEEQTRQREARQQAQRVAEAERARAETESLRVAEQRAAARRFKYAAAAALALAALALAAGGYAWSARGQALAAESRANRIQEEARTVAAGQEQLIASYQVANDAQQKVLNDLEKKLSGGAAAPTTNIAETERLRSEAAAYKDQLARLNAQASQIQRPKDNGQVEAVQRELDAANKRIADLDGQLKAERLAKVRPESPEDLSAALVNARADLRRLDDAMKELRSENERLKAENARLRADNDRLKAAGGKGGEDTTTGAEDAGVREALERYAAAHNSGAIATAVREMSAVFPGYDVQQWARARRDYSSYSMTINPASTIRYSSDGQSATVLATTVQRYQLVGGTQQERSGRMEFRLVKKGDTWTIAGAAAAG
jgi:hypothetical protein